MLSDVLEIIPEVRNPIDYYQIQCRSMADREILQDLLVSEGLLEIVNDPDDLNIVIHWDRSKYYINRHLDGNYKQMDCTELYYKKSSRLLGYYEGLRCLKNS